MLPPPVLVAGRYADAPPVRDDDWTQLAPPVASEPAGLDDSLASSSADEGGPRRQPELAQTVIYPEEPEPAFSDLALLDDDDLPVLPRQLDPAMQRVARQAALDPDDGIQL